MPYSILDRLMMGNNESSGGWSVADATVKAARSVEVVLDCTELIGHIADIPCPIFPYPIPPHRMSAVIGTTDAWEMAALIFADHNGIAAMVHLQFEGEPVSGPYFKISWPTLPKIPGCMVNLPDELESDVPLTPAFCSQISSIILGTLSAVNIAGSRWEDIDDSEEDKVAPWYRRRLVVDWESIEEAGMRIGFRDPIAIFNGLNPPNVAVDESYNKLNLFAEKGHWLQ